LQNEFSVRKFTRLKSSFSPLPMSSFAMAAAMLLTSSNSTVGFGTAALGPAGYDVVTMALEEGLRSFDTAEAEWWYDQKQVG
jgi:hypothetical protein